MTTSLNRRGFLASSAVAGAGMLLGSRIQAAQWKTTLRKSLIGSPKEDVLKSWKAAGFDGMETTDWKVTPEDAAAARKLAESLGMTIHSILFGWAAFNEGDAAMAKSIGEMETTLKAAQGYGAGVVLLVPCKVGGMKMPKPWEFDIRFDEKTGHVQQVVAGDNAEYQDYITAHNRAIDTSREAVKQLIPTAEKTGVVIALENVWNNLWVKPELSKNFIASFDSPWVKAYFDIGNHVKYAKPQDWIRTLGNLLVRCHVKDYKLGPDGRADGMDGFRNIRDGSVDWPAVRQALDDVGYSGWMTIEADNAPINVQSERLDLIIAGK